MRATGPGEQVRLRPRVLFLTYDTPGPLAGEGRRRELELIRRLADRFDIHLIAVSEEPEQSRAGLDLLGQFGVKVEAFAATRPTELELSELPSSPLHHRSPGATGRVGELLAHGEADLVHVEGYCLMAHIPDWADVPILLVERNIEYELERQHANPVEGPAADLDAFARSVRTREAEVECWSRATRVGVLCGEDRQAILAAAPATQVTLVPDGADHVLPRPAGSAALSSPDVLRPRTPLAVFAANFAYTPNFDAAVHLCEDILPLIRDAVPETQVWLVGNAPSERLQQLACDGVQVTGAVSDVVPFIDAADLVVFPLRIGGGVKVKLLEALRRGKAIVSSSIAADELPPAARSAVVSADDPRSFADAVTRILDDPGIRNGLERDAASAAASLLTWDDAAATFAGVYQQLLPRSQHHGRAQPPRAADG